MPALVEGDEPAIRQPARQSLPVASVGAETVEQKARWLSFAIGLWRPLQVVEEYPLALEPTVDRGEHRR
jgi:hypothetical protein